MISRLKLRRPSEAIVPLIALGLSVGGLVMILSASQFSAAQNAGNPYYFFSRQLLFWLLGVGLYFYFLRVPLEKLYQYRWRFLLVTLGLLILVLIPGVALDRANVNRWIGWGAISIQSAEVAKLFLIIFFAGFFAGRGMMMRSPVQTLIPFIFYLAAIVGLVILEPDMGTAIIIILIALAIWFVAGADLWHYGAVLIIGAALMLILVYIAPYRLQRLTVFLNRNPSPAAISREAYHSHQALIAIGTGGWWGVGFGQGVSKYAFLPETHTDSIFAVLAEELGFARSSLVLVAYLIIGFRGFQIAARANSRFVRLIAVGVTVSLTGQALINIGGMLGVLPLTGVPLPFISYGGSSLLVSMASVGLMTNASRETVTKF